MRKLGIKIKSRYVESEEERRERFWSRTERKGNCIMWRGPKGSGHGHFYWFEEHEWPQLPAKRVTQVAVRFAWESKHGKLDTWYGEPCENVKQRCGNALCVNPDHLYLQPITGRTPIAFE